MGEIKKKEYEYTIMMGQKASMAYRPIVDVEISCKTSSEIMSAAALVDSGTDGSVVNSEIAEALGIKREHCTPATLGGIGSMQGFVTNMTIKISDFDVKFDAPVIFADNLPFAAILGQRDLFERFKITFEKNKNKFALEVI